MTAPIYEDPMGHKVYRGGLTTDYPPFGCRICGIGRRFHCGRWSDVYGWHGWRQPSDQQVKERMLIRRAGRGGLQKVTGGIGWTPDQLSGVPYVTTLVMADMSSLAPLNPVDNVAVLAFYIGGNTPNVPTLAQVKAVGARYRLPIFTRSNPQSANVTTDVASAVAQLAKLGAPKGITVGLDLETAINPAYVTAFSGQMSGQHGYEVLAYGSKSSLFHNPEPTAGYWVADYTDTPHLYPGTVATQYADAGMAKRPYDLSLINSAVKLWDTQAPTTSAGSTGDPHVAVLQELLNELNAGLLLDGVKGSHTKSAFYRQMETYGTIEQGDTGTAVKLVQAMINTWSAVVTLPFLVIDGEFGVKTLASVKDFQLERRVSGGPDGQVGPATKAALSV